MLKAPREYFGYVGTPDEPVAVPRLIGFAPNDSGHALALGYLRGRVGRVLVASGRRRVVAQSPAPGRILARGTRVRLRVAGR